MIVRLSPRAASRVTVRPNDPDPSSDDAELVARVRAGALDALGGLYARHAARLMALAYRLTGSAQDAEDVLHDVFLGLPEALRRYDERGSFDGWIGRVTARAAITRLRARGRRHEVPLTAHAAHAAAPGSTAADRAALADAIGRLPDSLREVFVLKEVEGYSHAQVAEMLGISVGASEVRLCRAVKALRDILRKGDE
jgi:RNA polymerase sigma-70 factor, ECF subfamily